MIGSGCKIVNQSPGLLLLCTGLGATVDDGRFGLLLLLINIALGLLLLLLVSHAQGLR